MPQPAWSTIGWNNWTVPSDCRLLDWCWVTGAGYPGAAGANAVGGFYGAGGNGGGGGAASLKNNIPTTPGELLQVYVGNQGEHSGLYRSGTWLCLAYGGSGINGGNAAIGVGDTRNYGANGAAGATDTSGVCPGGNGGAAAGPWAGGGGAGGAGGITYAASGSPGGPGGGYGGGGGGGGGGAYVGGPGGGGGPAYSGLVVANYTPYVMQPPSVGALSKQIGKATGGETITVTGVNFDKGVTAVKFGSVNAASFTYINATTLTCVTPAQPSGTLTNVLVTTSDGTSGTSSVNQFRFVAGVGGNMPMLGF